MKLFTFPGLAAISAQAAFALFTSPSFAQAHSSVADHAFGGSRPIPGRYVVLFNSNVDNPAVAAAGLVSRGGGQLLHTYTAAIKGFAANLPEAAVQALRNNPNVAFVEQDQTVSLTQVASPQNQVTWGLDRIDQADRPLDTQYHFTSTGAGVHAFIIDTGIRADHVEFAGRVRPGYTSLTDGFGTNDCHGHGTHVAGTLGGTTWGVAKGVSITPVRVLDCAGSGAWSGVIAGIDWVANSTLRPAVANMSLGGPLSAAVDAAVAGAVAKGVTLVVAAGNSSIDACTVSPAREPTAVTVGATAENDYRGFYSNVGPCVDLFAPGNNITSAWHTASNATGLLNGTSMASPHVAGVAALMLQANPSATPAGVAAQLVATATPNRLTALGTGSPNLLLNSLGSGGAIVPPATKVAAVESLVGSSTRTGGNWKASAAVTVRDVNTGARVGNATVTGTFSPGGTASCVTDSTGNCSLGSGSLKANSVRSTVLGVGGIAGPQLSYDSSQNAATQIVISRP